MKLSIAGVECESHQIKALSPRVIVDCTYDRKPSHHATWKGTVAEAYAANQFIVGDIEVNAESLVRDLVSGPECVEI